MTCKLESGAIVDDVEMEAWRYNLDSPGWFWTYVYKKQDGMRHPMAIYWDGGPTLKCYIIESFGEVIKQGETH